MPEQVEREILEAIARYLTNENQPVHPDIFVSSEGLRSMIPRFGIAAHLGEEFLGRLHAMQGKDFVKVVLPSDGSGYRGATVALTPTGLDRLLYADDADYLALQRSGSQTITLFGSTVHQLAATTGANSQVSQHQTVTDMKSILPLIERLLEEVRKHPELPEDTETEAEQLKLEATKNNPNVQRITGYLESLKRLATGVAPIIQIVLQVLQMVHPHAAAGSGPIVP